MKLKDMPFMMVGVLVIIWGVAALVMRNLPGEYASEPCVPPTTKEPAGENVSGAAIAQEEGEETPAAIDEPMAESFSEEPFELIFSEPQEPVRGEAAIWRNVHIGDFDGPTLGDIIDRLSVLEKTIVACCGSEYRDPEAEENLTVMVTLRKKVMELEARILGLEHR